jgi:peptidoglycan/LPS O-acetylase OafA/YrhL
MTHAHDDSRDNAQSIACAPEPVAAGWTPVLLPGGRAAPGPRRRFAGLDGLRAVAVLAVVVFHLDYGIAPGGFLGVDVFFVISGFLITTLVANEILETGRLRLGAFYLRRARRLLPAVFVLLLVVTIASATLWPDQLATLRGGALASAGYVTNWWLIAADQNYFVWTGRPPMVQHLWSLAIEEQFYLVWSVVVMTVVTVAARRINPVARVRLVALIALACALASTTAMAVLAVRSGLPYFGDTSRVYYGSDTHSMGLFLGSACGAALAVRARTAAAPARSDRLPAKFLWLTDVAGAVALMVLLVELVTVTEFSSALYRGGFLAFDALVLAVLVCGTRRRSLLGRILDMRPMRWVGRRSYSIYIWHWPVVVVTRPDLDVRGPALLIDLCRLALILGLGALSYHFVEVPLRTGGYARWRAGRSQGRRRGWDALAVTVTVAAALGLVAASSSASSPTLPGFVAHRTPVAPPRSAAPPVGSRSASLPGAPAARSHHAAAGVARGPVSAFGDSVLLGASDALRRTTGRLALDAVEGRQPYQVLDDVLARAAHGTLAPRVLIHTGNNGIISAGQLRSTLAALRDRTRVVLVTDRVPREWQDLNNATIRSVGRQFRNVRVLDWYAASSGRAGWLYSDGLHLTPAGAQAYARLIGAALGTGRPR